MDGATKRVDAPAGGKPASGAYPRRMEVDRAARPMDIAVVYSRVPLPMTRADQMTVAHLLAFLSARGHNVDLFCLSEGIPATAEQRAWIEKQCRHVTIVKQARWRSAVGAVAALSRGLPLQVGWFDNTRLKSAVRRALKDGRFDVAYCYYLRSAEPVRGRGRPRKTGAGAGNDTRPVTYLAMQLSQALNTRRIAENAPSWYERLLYSLESRLIRRYEARVWQDFTRTVLIGEADVREISQACADEGVQPIDNYVLSPHGVDTDRFAPRDGQTVDPYGLVFSGVMATNTNVNAVLWFVEFVWPRVRAAVPEATFTVVGRMPRPEIRALADLPGITVTGEVPDPADHIRRAAVCVNSMQAGAGMQNKLLEYLSMAKPVVATSVANEAIRAEPGSEIMIADDAEAFAAAVVALLRDPARRDRLGSAARGFVKSEWTWEAHFLKLEADMIASLDSANG